MILDCCYHHLDCFYCRLDHFCYHLDPAQIVFVVITSGLILSCSQQLVLKMHQPHLDPHSHHHPVSKSTFMYTKFSSGKSFAKFKIIGTLISCRYQNINFQIKSLKFYVKISSQGVAHLTIQDYIL